MKHLAQDNAFSFTLFVVLFALSICAEAQPVVKRIGFRANA